MIEKDKVLFQQFDFQRFPLFVQVNQCKGINTPICVDFAGLGFLRSISNIGRRENDEQRTRCSSYGSGR